MRISPFGKKVRIELPSGEWEEVGQPLVGVFWGLVVSTPVWVTIIYLVC